MDGIKHYCINVYRLFYYYYYFFNVFPNGHVYSDVLPFFFNRFYNLYFITPLLSWLMTLQFENNFGSIYPDQNLIKMSFIAIKISLGCLQNITDQLKLIMHLFQNYVYKSCLLVIFCDDQASCEYLFWCTKFFLTGEPLFVGIRYIVSIYSISPKLFLIS